MGKVIQHSLVRFNKMWTIRPIVWISLLLGGLDSYDRNNGRAFQYVASCKWALSLDMDACTRTMESSAELCDRMVSSLLDNYGFGLAS